MNISKRALICLGSIQPKRALINKLASQFCSLHFYWPTVFFKVLSFTPCFLKHAFLEMCSCFNLPAVILNDFYLSNFINFNSVNFRWFLLFSLQLLVAFPLFLLDKDFFCVSHILALDWRFVGFLLLHLQLRFYYILFFGCFCWFNLAKSL